MLIWFAAYLATGAAVGVLAGLLGIGGGMTLVPILAAIFAAREFAPDHVVHLALGTAMASIVFTSTASVREHARLGSVDLGIVRRIAPGLVGGSLLSTFAAGWIEQRHLALAFAVIVYLGATQILLNRRPAPRKLATAHERPQSEPPAGEPSARASASSVTPATAASLVTSATAATSAKTVASATSAASEATGATATTGARATTGTSTSQTAVEEHAEGNDLPGPVILTLVSLLIGVICGLVSAGGAFLTIPFMLWCRVPARSAIGTAAALGIPIAAVGSVGYILSGWSVPDLPDGSFGFIYLYALAGLVCGSVLTAPFGARLAHRLPVLTLKRIFAVLLYALATKMLLTYW